VKLSIIIPYFNEASHITEVLDSVRTEGTPKEIIVVDDGSTDDTAKIVEEYNKRFPIVTHHSKVNAGKGAAIRAGLEYVTGDIVVIQDADMEYDPSQYPELIRPILDGEADVVYGSRFLGKIEGMRLLNRICNHILAWTANILYGARITDEATCYKAFKAELIKSLPLKCRKFEFCPEVTARIRKRGIRIKEIPIRYRGRSVSEGKKIKWTDAVSAIWTLLKYRFVD
jgi:dolichol-phosphate mannosyltransferase